MLFFIFKICLIRKLEKFCKNMLLKGVVDPPRIAAVAQSMQTLVVSGRILIAQVLSTSPLSFAQAHAGAAHTYRIPFTLTAGSFNAYFRRQPGVPLPL